MISMFEAYCTGKWEWQLSIKFMSFMRLERLQQSKDSLKACFEKCKYYGEYGKCSKISNTLKLQTPKIIAENNF